MKLALGFATLCVLICGVCFSAATTGAEAGRKQDQVSCVPCHSLRLVDS
jgi:hypothetical protein